MPRTADFERLLNGAIGLSVATIGRSVLDRALQERASARGCRDLEAYWECVRASEAELQALIDAVVVAETWFFRHDTSFSGLARLVQDEWLTPRDHDVLRLLSVPCASGEEPYSMAMSLFDAGLSANRFRIDAVDVSTRALEMAERGVYRANAFRGVDADVRDRHFTNSTGGYRVSDAVRRQVRFLRGNLLAAETLLGAGVYDVVFCRNVLIYFDRATQEAILPALRRLLVPHGVLFVAPAETGLAAGHGFVPLDQPLSFAFRRAERPNAPETAPGARTRPTVSQPASPRPPRARQAREEPAAIPVERAPNEHRPTDADAGLRDALRLADGGHLVEAARFCEAHIEAHGTSAEAFYLLGVVRDAAGSQAEAADCYRKALYLDPSHSDAQIHLAFLMERLGQHHSALALRDRARRIERKRQVRHD